MSNVQVFNIQNVPSLQARLKNILLTRKHPWEIKIGENKALLRPLNDVIPTKYSIIITLQVSDELCFLAIQDDSWLYTHASFNQVQNLSNLNLPITLKQALVEFFIEPHINYLSNLLETNINIASINIIDDTNNCIYSNESESITLENLNSDFIRIPLACNIDFINNISHTEAAHTTYIDFYLARHLKGEVLLQKLNALPIQEQSKWSDEELDCVVFEASFEAGYVILKNSEILQLEQGDILLPDEYYTQNIDNSFVKLFLGTKGFIGNTLNDTEHSVDYAHKKQYFLSCALQNDTATVLKVNNNLVQSIENTAKESLMSEQNEAKNNSLEQDIKTEDDQTLPIEEIQSDLEAIISFELERRILSLADIKAINQGYTFALATDKDSPVTLRINGKAMGKGKLVDIDGILGVQIVSLGTKNA